MGSMFDDRIESGAADLQESVESPVDTKPREIKFEVGNLPESFDEAVERLVELLRFIDNQEEVVRQYATGDRRRYRARAVLDQIYLLGPREELGNITRALGIRDALDTLIESSKHFNRTAKDLIDTARHRYEYGLSDLDETRGVALSGLDETVI